MASLPKLVSLFLCDEVLHDLSSGKSHVLGMFDAIRPHEFPHQQARVGVFVALSGQPGTVACRVQCLGSEGDVTFRTLPRTLKFSRRRPILRVYFRVLHAQFRKPGIYQMQFVCEDRVLTEQRFVVLSGGANGDA